MNSVSFSATIISAPCSRFSLIYRHFHFYDCNILIFQFSTLRVAVIFQYEGELYLLATDQGYLNQPDLVWEKLNEVSAY